MDDDPLRNRPPGALHDANGRFAKGNPGRRKGSRNRMTRQLALGLLDDMLVNEEDNIRTMRRWYFPQYVQLMTRFIPREAARQRPDFADYAPTETAQVLAAARVALEAAERGEAGLDALLTVLESDPAALGAPPDGAAEAQSNDVKYVESTSAVEQLLATIHPTPEGVGEDTSNDVKYVESTSPSAPPAPIDDGTLKCPPLRRN